MSTTHITPTPGRIVWYRGADGEIRPAIVMKGNGPFNADLYVFPLSGADTDWGNKATVTHADPEQEPGCLQSWHWMPYQKQQAEKHANEMASTAGPKTGNADASEAARAEEPKFIGFTGASCGGIQLQVSTLQPHQQRVVDEKAELDERLAKLRTFFDTAIFGGLDAAEQSRLRQQAHAMACYSAILGERIAAFASAAESAAA